MNGHLLWGVYALAVFPTTISSCIVLTQLVRGNAAAAIFNAVLANMLGVFVSPLLLTLLLSTEGAAMPMAEVGRIFLALGAKVLAPFVAGQLIRTQARAFADRHITASWLFPTALSQEQSAGIRRRTYQP